jgi:hypothetical protein
VHRRLRKNRFPARHAALVFAPLVVTYLAAAGRVTLGGSLDLLWLLLTIAAVIHCLQERGRGASRVPQLVSLALVLALFFPVVSLDDDRAQQDLPGELQSLISPPSKHRQSHANLDLRAPTLLPAHHLALWLRSSFELVTPARTRLIQCAWCQASGNHSPPLG